MTNPAQTYFEAKKAYDIARKTMDAAKAELLEMMDAANVDAIMLDGYMATRSISERMAFDSKAFRADFDDVYNEYKRPQKVNNFSVKAA
jgi:hypothetical protein